MMNKNLERISKLKFIEKFYKSFKNSNLYLVGGALRDYFLGIDSSDFDLVAEGINQEELINYLEEFGDVISIEGRTFGVIKFRPTEDQEVVIDIALPRRESYLAGQRRKDARVEIGGTIVDDLARRDFTINALAIPLVPQQDSELLESRVTNFLIDPYLGHRDLENRIIRAVGDPKERFLEDPTRILRGIRFAIKFDFTIEHKTYEAMKESRVEILKKYTDEKGKELERVSWEVIGQEFLKTLEINPAKALESYEELALLPLILPEIEAMKGVKQPPQFHSEGDVFAHTKLALEALPKNSSLRVKIATLLHDVGKPYTFKSAKETGDRIRFNNHDRVGMDKATKILRRLKLPNKIIEDVAWLIGNHMRLPFGFPRMRLDKQKNFVRHPLFKELLVLVCADASASIYPDGTKNDCLFLEPVKKIMEQVQSEKLAGLPVELINGDEVIKVVKEVDPRFDPEKEGKKIGAIKKEINSLYDRGELRTKKEAFKKIRELLNSQGNF